MTEYRFRIVVTGSRDFPSLGLVHAVLWEAQSDHGLLKVATGGSGVVDQEVENLGYEPTIYKADWQKYGRLAGPLRNHHMIDDFKPHRVYAFWDGKSRGTLDCFSYAAQKGIQVFIFPPVVRKSND